MIEFINNIWEANRNTKYVTETLTNAGSIGLEISFPLDGFSFRLTLRNVGLNAYTPIAVSALITISINIFC